MQKKNMLQKGAANFHAKRAYYDRKLDDARSARARIKAQGLKTTMAEDKYFDDLVRVRDYYDIVSRKYDKDLAELNIKAGTFEPKTKTGYYGAKVRNIASGLLSKAREYGSIPISQISQYANNQAYINTINQNRSSRIDSDFDEALKTAPDIMKLVKSIENF